MSTPTTPLIVTPKPSAPVSLASQVNAASAKTAPIPKGMGTGRSTMNLEQIWMRAMVYGETNARKTTVSAEFAGPEATRIILTRGEDQLLPLAGRDFKYELCDTTEKLRYAMLYPENLWPEWVNVPNRTLVIDDITKAKDMLLDSNEYSDKGTKQNNMIVHRESKLEMAEMMKSVFAKPMHVIAIAFANIYENAITHEENVTPDLPPGMNRMLTADFSFVFFIDKAKQMFRTTDFRETYQDLDEKMQTKTFTRVILAKHKLPKQLEGKGVINDLEKMDLAEIWRKVTQGKK